ncbi:hypothetical protein HK405_012910, partial [Cladochytrium tenue]
TATYETQFGFIQRPTHYNNSWDLARFEVCGHKFADLSEFGYGVALLNDCKYGYACKGNVMRLSLLRSSKAPDLHADIGEHTFRYALYPHRHSFLESDVVREAYQFNVPPITIPAPGHVAHAHRQMPLPPLLRAPLAGASLFSVSAPNLVLDAVKLAEHPRTEAMIAAGGAFDVVLRLYEAYGGRGVATVASAFSIAEAHRCNVLEDLGAAVERTKDGGLIVPFGPFKIVTLRLLVKPFAAVAAA